MAKKSKTQRAKASAKRAAKKEESLEVTPIEEQEGAAVAESSKEDTKKPEKKVEKAKPKQERFKFLKDVRAELKRVTWPTKKDVTQWSGVVVAALLFFGIYVAILDNFVMTPALVGVSSIEIEGVTPKTEAELQAENSSSSSTSSDSTTTLTDTDLLSLSDVNSSDSDSSTSTDSTSEESTSSDTQSSATEDTTSQEQSSEGGQ